MQQMRWINGKIPEVGNVINWLTKRVDHTTGEIKDCIVLGVEIDTPEKAMLFKSTSWILSADMPVPALSYPDPHPCPYCGNQCVLDEFARNRNPHYVRCIMRDCSYQSAGYPSPFDAVIAHNVVCSEKEDEQENA